MDERSSSGALFDSTAANLTDGLQTQRSVDSGDDDVAADDAASALATFGLGRTSAGASPPPSSPLRVSSPLAASPRRGTKQVGQAVHTTISADKLKRVAAAIAGDHLSVFIAAVGEALPGMPLDVVHSVPFNAHAWCIPHLAAANDAFSILQWCSEVGADINMATTDSGWTPMHFAAFNATERCCALLRHLGADHTIRDHYGDRACDIAVMVGQPRIAELLGDDSVAKAQQEEEDAEYRQVLAEARALEREREAAEERRRQEAEEEEQRKIRRAERIERMRRLRLIFEGERLSIVSRWLIQRQNLERDALQMSELLHIALVMGAEQLSRLLLELAEAARASAAAAAGGGGCETTEDIAGAQLDVGNVAQRGVGRKKVKRAPKKRNVNVPHADGSGNPRSLPPLLPPVLAKEQQAPLRPESNSSNQDLGATRRRASSAVGFVSRIRRVSSIATAATSGARPTQTLEERRSTALGIVASGGDLGAIEDPFVLIPDDPSEEISLPAPRGGAILSKKKRQEFIRFRDALERERSRRLAMRSQEYLDFMRRCAGEQDVLCDDERCGRKDVALEWFIGLGGVAQRDPTIDRYHPGTFGVRLEGENAGHCGHRDGGDAGADADGGRTAARDADRREGSALGLGLIAALQLSASSSLDEALSDATDPNVSGREALCRWSCCGQSSFAALGCEALDDGLRALHHAGEYRFHLPRCDCGRLSSAGSGIVFCNPGGFVWSCCGATDHDSDGCAHHKRFLFSPNIYVDQRFTQQPEEAFRTVVVAIDEALAATNDTTTTTSSSETQASCDASGAEKCGGAEGMASSAAAPQLSQRRASMSAAALIGTLPNARLSEAAALTGSEVGHGAEERASPSSCAVGWRGSRRRRSTITTTTAAGCDSHSARGPAPSRSTLLLDSVTRGTFARSHVWGASFSTFSTQSVVVSESGQTVAHALGICKDSGGGDGVTVTRTNVFGHYPMDCSRNRDNVYCFSLILDECPAPRTVTEERMVIGIVVASLDDTGSTNSKAGTGRSRRHARIPFCSDDGREGSPMAANDADDNGDGEDDFHASRTTTAPEVTGAGGEGDGGPPLRRKSTRKLRRMASRAKFDVVSHAVGDGHRVEAGEMSPSRIAASSLRAAQDKEVTARAPRTVQEALEGQFIGGSLGIGWWAHSREIRGLGVKAEASRCFKQGDTVTVVIDGTNNLISFFVNRTIAAQARLDARRVFRPAVTLVAGCKFTSEPSFKRSSLQFVEQYMREKATVERLFRLKHTGLAHAFAEYETLCRTSGQRSRQQEQHQEHTNAALRGSLPGSPAAAEDHQASAQRSAEDAEEEAVKIVF